MLEQRNKEMDTNLKIEERVDERNTKIKELGRDLQRKTDEVNLRREVLDSMGDNLVKYENENRDNREKIKQLEN